MRSVVVLVMFISSTVNGFYNKGFANPVTGSSTVLAQLKMLIKMAYIGEALLYNLPTWVINVDIRAPRVFHLLGGGDSDL